jgi:curli biogenesis system outer membrane secretion channel CsgG
MSGDVSDESAVSIGQMLGANIVIIGSITETGRNQRLVLRALDVRTSEIITMAREEF